jgi:hypothetical protein
MMIAEQLVECELAEVTEVLGENLPQRHYYNHISPHDLTRLGANNRLSYSTV